MEEVKVFDTFGQLLEFAIQDGRPFEHFPTNGSKFIARFLPNAKFLRVNVIQQSAEEIISETLGVFHLGKANNGEIILYSFVKSTPVEMSAGELIIQKHLTDMKQSMIEHLPFHDVLDLWNDDRKTFDKYEKNLKLERFADNLELAKINDSEFSWSDIYIRPTEYSRLEPTINWSIDGALL